MEVSESHRPSIPSSHYARRPRTDVRVASDRFRWRGGRQQDYAAQDWQITTVCHLRSGISDGQGLEGGKERARRCDA